ncbi:MAG: ATP synthase F1 subunit gamma [Candidatus Xenobia bacterium]
MAGVRDIVGRIKTVQNIQQITKAMKMVAAARIKRAEQRLKAARPYTQKMEEVLDDLVSAMGGGAHPLMAPRPVVKSIGLVIVSADKGLCGAYNSQLLRRVQQFLNEVPKETEVRIIVFGSKALRWLNRRKLPVETQVTGFKATFEEAQSAAQQVTQWFVEDKVQEVHAIYTEVVTAMTQRPRVVKVLPLAREKGKAATSVPYDFEPSPDQALNVIVPRYLESRLYLMLLEARAAELAARLKAMSNATDNAEKVVATLRLQYFRARQDQITGELIEIASGAASLKK